MSKAKLKEGVVLRPYGPSSEITNESLTDEVAVYLLESGKAQESDFEVAPKYTKPEPPAALPAAARNAGAPADKTAELAAANKAIEKLKGQIEKLKTPAPKKLTVPQAKGALTVAKNALIKAEKALQDETDEEKKAPLREAQEAAQNKVHEAEKTLADLENQK